MKYRTVLFDFDGTLMDTSRGIMICAKKTLEEMGYAIPDDKTMRKFIGPPLKLSFVSVCGMSDEEATEAVMRYRENYALGGVLDAEIYPGIEDLLQSLNAAGVNCAVASVKVEKRVRQTLLHFGLNQYFSAVCGASGDINIKGKEEIVKQAVSRTNSLPQDCLLVGDSDYDARGAQAAGIDFCAVLWGFGFSEIGDAAPFDCRYIAEDVPALKRFLLK